MDQAHIDFLASPEWARLLETDLLPWVEAAGDLGDHVLEIGPGPGLTTDMLRSRAGHVTAVELDAVLAEALADRLAGTNVEVLVGDGTDTRLPADRFSAATCFSMLHHMPSAEEQDRLLAEVHRVLRPGGTFVGVDALDLDFLRDAHEGDVFTPVDPEGLADRLARAGLEATALDVGDYQFRFAATKPA